MRTFGERDRGGVGADMTGNTRQHIEARALVQLQAEVGGLDAHGTGDGQRERCAAEFGRVDGEEQVVHDRIADEHRVEDVVALDIAFGTDLVDEAGDGLAHGDRHALAAVGIHHHIGDTAHQILAEADLRIGRPG